MKMYLKATEIEMKEVKDIIKGFDIDNEEQDKIEEAFNKDFIGEYRNEDDSIYASMYIKKEENETSLELDVPDEITVKMLKIATKIIGMLAPIVKFVYSVSEEVSDILDSKKLKSKFVDTKNVDKE